MDRFAEAEAITESLIVRFPENEDVWLDHSDVLFEKGQIAQAIQIINEGWQKNPQSADLGYRKVAYLLELGEKQEAHELLFRMFMHDPEGLEELEEYYPNIKTDLLFIELTQQRKG